jgi:hypothetical protein
LEYHPTLADVLANSGGENSPGEQQLAEARISATTANRYVTLVYGSAKLSLPIGVAVSPDGRYTYVTNNGNS